MTKMPKKLIKSRRAQNAAELKKGRQAIKAEISRNAKGLLKSKIAKCQKSQKV